MTHQGADPKATAVTDAYISLGSNLGDRIKTLKTALDMIAALPGTHLHKTSSWYETQAVGGVATQDFINGACHVSTTLSPNDLLGALLEIESKLGRVRHEKWGDRICDLDLMIYGNLVLETPALTLPHPGLADRMFMIAPLVEIAPDLVIPGKSVKIQDIALLLDDTHWIKRFSEKEA